MPYAFIVAGLALIIAVIIGIAGIGTKLFAADAETSASRKKDTSSSQIAKNENRKSMARNEISKRLKALSLAPAPVNLSPGAM